MNGSVARPNRIWCQQGTAIEVELKPDTTGFSAASKIILEIAGDTGAILKSVQFTGDSKEARAAINAHKSGWFALRLTGDALPPTGAAYELTVNYTGTQELAL
jgi:hypothetical protein